MTGRAVNGEVMGPLERGRSRYQQKNYTGALDAFTEAVQITTGNLLLTALDHRAATYEKMAQLQAALRDSKQMIELKPELAKGYLRCGKVLQLKGEKELALKIYERGLRKVKIGTDNDRTTLQSAFNKLRQALDPGKSLDPLQFLPFELAEMVMQNLEIRDRVICLAVCKSWKRLLESSYNLWTILDTTSARRPVTQNSLKTYLRRSNYTLDKAIISMRAKFDVPKMVYLTRTCTQLEYLQICGSGVIGESLTTALHFAQNLSTIVISANCEVSLFTIRDILRICQKTLVEATFLRVTGLDVSHWPKLDSLRRLNFRIRSHVEIDIVQLLESAPDIESFTLDGEVSIDVQGPRLDLTRYKHLEHLQLSNGACQLVPIFPPTLKYLDISGNLRLGERGIGDDELFEIPLLESFNCESTCFTGALIERITRQSIKSGNLKSLQIGNRIENPNVRPLGDKYLVSETVEELSMAGMTSGERQVLDTVKLFPNLKKLDVSMTRITGVAVKDFVNMGIKSLKLNECRSISPDAVEYARGKGVQVEFNFPSDRARGFRDSNLF